MASSLTRSVWEGLPDYVRAADEQLTDPHTTAGFLRRFLGNLTGQADVVMSVIDALDPITNPSGKSCAADPATAPAELVPVLALAAGLWPDYADVPVDKLRDLLARPPEWRRRGSAKAMAASVALTLTGSQTVEVENHVGGDMWHMRVLVVAGEMADVDATYVAALREKPVGVKILEVLATATPHTHTIGQLAGRGSGHSHTIGQLAGRSTGHGHTIGQLAGRP